MEIVWIGDIQLERFDLKSNQCNLCLHFEKLKDKSGVGIIVDYSRDYTVVNGCSTFFNFSLLICETIYFNLLRSAK